MKINFKNYLKYFNLYNLIYLVLFSLPLYLVKLNIYNIPTTILELEIYLLSFCFLISALKNNYLKRYVINFIKNPFFIPWLVFFIAGVVSVVISPDKKISLGIFKAYFFDAALLFFIICSVIKNKQEIKNCFKSLIFSAVVLCVVGLAQYFFFPSSLQDDRIRSVFASPNYLSMYITPVSFIVYSIVRGLKNRRFNNIVLLSCYLVILLTIFLTFSRGAWLGLLLGLIFFFGMMIIKRFKLFSLKLLFASLFLIGFLASSFFIVKGSYGLGLVPKSRVEQSDNIRKEIWATSLDIGLQHKWIGIGLGNFQNYFGEYTKHRINYQEYITPNAVTPHNIFFNIWLQTGLLGLVSILALLVIFFTRCLRGLKKEFIINIILMASMVAILGQGLVDSTIWKNDLILIFWFMVCSAYIINRKGEKNGE